VLRLRPGQRHAVVEVGIDAAGQMAIQADIVRPDVAVITGIGSEHQDALGSLETTQREKSRLLGGLRPRGLAVLNGDDPRVLAMVPPADARVVTYGFGPDNDIRASDIRLDWPNGTRFILHALGTTREVLVQLLGRSMVRAILAAVAVAASEGLPLDTVVSSLEQLRPANGRLQLLRLPSGINVIRDDGKASVETIHAAFDVLEQVPGRRLLVLSRSPTWPDSLEPDYRRVAQRMAQMLTAAILVGSDMDRLATWALEAGMAPAALHRSLPGVTDAIAILRQLVRPDDTVLLKGRLYQRLERVALGLEGRVVNCDLSHCELVPLRCETCPMLTKGWGDRRVVR
jgi:UDP-N-acetylmuramoyl-tripeptide--D-alanyl-D-alanine ligase